MLFLREFMIALVGEEDEIFINKLSMVYKNNLIKEYDKYYY